MKEWEDGHGNVLSPNLFSGTYLGSFSFGILYLYVYVNFSYNHNERMISWTW